MRDIREVEPGVYSVLDGDRSFEVRVNETEARVDGRSFTMEWTDPRQWNPRASRLASGASAHVKSPMPGKIIRVLVNVNDAVVAGQGIVIVEAMKMQNELRSPRDGHVQNIAVEVHDTVSAGAILATIE